MRPAPTTRAQYRAFSTLTTRWIDNDIYGHMNNAVHYQLFDTAVNGHLLEQGALDSGAALGCFWWSKRAVTISANWLFLILSQQGSNCVSWARHR